jgi:Crinkler effector protein N-terminal domain
MSNLGLWCFVLGDKPPSMRVFQVQVPLEANIAGLKEVIKEKKRPEFDHIAANMLDLYRVTVPMDNLDEFNDIGPDSLKDGLLPRQKLSQVFAGLPTDDYLYIVAVPPPGGCEFSFCLFNFSRPLPSHTWTHLLYIRSTPPEIPRKSVHRLSETSHYEAFKRQKVVTMAPSDLATSSEYEPLQNLSTERILDDRPEPDLDIPPIPLLYDGFGHFLDIMDGRTDIPGLNLVDMRKLQAGVDKLAHRMCLFYTHEDERRDRALPILNEILAAHSGVQIPLVQPASIGPVRSGGHIIWRNGAVTLLTEFKNRSTGNNAMPDVELVGYVAHLHKQKMQDDKKLFREWRVPCLGLTVVGECEHITYSC